MYSNREILSAVLVKWAQPALQEFLGGKLGTLPGIANIESKLRSTGWVSPMWSLGAEIAPLVGNIAAPVIEPMLSKYLEGIPDEALPQMAHSLVENAIKQGGLSLFEGKIEFEKEDLEELLTLLRYNLPYKKVMGYQVLTNEANIPSAS